MSVPQNRGFALITVLGVVLIVAAVALSLAATMRTEARQVQGDRVSLEMDQLSVAGHEMAAYLASSRGLGSAAEDLEGLPVDVVRAGFHYVVHLSGGNVDLYLDAEDGKLNLSTAPDAILEGFLAAWSQDASRGRALAAAVKDWRDADDEETVGGAEAARYKDDGYVPRNAVLGVGDVGLLRGLSAEDFRDRLVMEGTELKRYSGLSEFLTNAPVGTSVNPNYATALVLGAVPGLSPQVVERALVQRRNGLFRDSGDFARRTGLPEDSTALTFLGFGRRVPSVLSVARSSDGRVVRSERRVYWPLSSRNPATGAMDTVSVVGSVEKNVFPDYAPATP